MQGRIASNEVNQSYCVLTATRPSAIAIQKPRREIFISGSPRFKGRATPLALFISARWASVSRDQETSYQETRRDPPTDFLAFYDRAPDDHFVGSERGADLPTKVFGAADEEPAGGVDACPQNDAAREEGEGTGHLLLHLLALASARPRSHFVSRGSDKAAIFARELAIWVMRASLISQHAAASAKVPTLSSALYPFSASPSFTSIQPSHN
jgi:hypothetical protein